MVEQTGSFLNRELSWLKFNTRVLLEAGDRETPLLERLKFIAITASNLDEFFMVRVAAIKQQWESGMRRPDESGLTVAERLSQIAHDTRAQVNAQYRLLRGILRRLTAHGIVFADIAALEEGDREWVEKYFFQTIYPVITPLAVDVTHPFPFLANRSLNLAVLVGRPDGETDTAVVQVPSVLPRLVELPAQGGINRYLYLEDIIKAYCAHLFLGRRIIDVVPFRITRDAGLSIDEDDAEDLLTEVEKSLRQRKRGQPVRLETGKTGNPELRRFLVEALRLGEEDIYEITGPIDTTFFMKFADIEGFDHLRHAPLVPQTPCDLLGWEDLFAAIRENDILLHHPYEAFDPVLDFVRRAAADPAVLAIKQTLYRVSGNSPIVQALAQAAENGKQVTVLVELKARFDEERNILWARRLEEAGAHVIYGLVGLKTHGKAALVVRQEAMGIRRYVHFSTGNYNDATARIYTDLGLFTCNDQTGADASAFFNMISGYSDPPVWNKLVVAPLGLREKIKDLIDREINHARGGNPGRIVAKMNSLVDTDIIEKLYEASEAGVRIELIVRGICVLRPGVPGLSRNITVRSIVGRFLEHSRIYYFANDGDEKVFLSSADWMPRNLNNRVEIMFPVDDPAHIRRIKGILSTMLKDNVKALIMKADGTYRRADRRGGVLSSQEVFYHEARSAAQTLELPLELRLQPMYRKTD